MMYPNGNVNRNTLQSSINPDPGFKGKNLQLTKKFTFFFQKCNFLIPRPPLKRTSKLQKSSSLKREHQAIQNLNFLLHFCESFWPSWIRIPILNADPTEQNECGSGSATLVTAYVLVHLGCDVDLGDWLSRRG